MQKRMKKYEHLFDFFAKSVAYYIGIRYNKSKKNGVFPLFC